MNRLGRSALEVTGQTLLVTPKGSFGAAASSQAPCLGLELLVNLSSHPKLEVSAVQELVGPKRSAEQHSLCPVPLLPLSRML